MEQRVQLVTLGVGDLQRSRSFYSDGLGWSSFLDLEEVIFYQIGHGLALSLFRMSDLGTEIGRTPVVGSSFNLAHNVGTADEVAEVLDTARKAGGAVTVEAHTASWGGTQGYFTDPDGYWWEVAHNPGLTVDDNGNIHIGPVEPG